MCYLELILHMSIKLCHKVLLAHAEQGVLVLLRKVVPVLSQSLQSAGGSCHLIMPRGSPEHIQQYDIFTSIGTGLVCR